MRYLVSLSKNEEKFRIQNKNELQANLEKLWAIEAKAKTK